MTIFYSFIPILMFNTMIFIGLFGYSLVIVLPWDLQSVNELAPLSCLWYVQFLPLEFLEGGKSGYKTTNQWAPKQLFPEQHQGWPWVGSCIILFPPAVLLAEIAQHCLFYSLANRKDSTLSTVVSSCKRKQYLFLVSILGFEIPSDSDIVVTQLWCTGSISRKSIISSVLICTFRVSSKRK